MAENNKILLALKDPEEAAEISEYLKAKGCELTDAADGAKAIEMSLKEPPLLIVIDVDLPVISGDRVFQILTNNPHTAKVPFVFLSDSVAYVKAFRVGKDIFLTRPFNVEELFGRIKQTLLSTGKEEKEADTGEMRGSLAHMSLVDLLQVLHFNKKEGELKATSGKISGTVYIKDGQIYNVLLGEAEKEKALFRLLSWKEGTFEFLPEPISVPQRMQSSTGNLLMEGMRQLDEFEKSKHLFPDVDSTLKPKVDTTTLPKGLKPIIYEVLFLLDFHSKVGDLSDHCSFPDYEIYKTLTSLINRGILEVEEASEETGALEEEEKEFISSTQAVLIKEKVVNRWPEMLSVNFGKIFLVPSSVGSAMELIHACKRLPGFSLSRAISSSKASEEVPLGEIGALKLYGGMEVVFFVVPTVKHMLPLLSAFSTNLIGLMLLCSEEDTDYLPELADTKNEILRKRRVPAVHIFSGSGKPEGKVADSFKKAFSLESDEPLFTFNPASADDSIFKILQALFQRLIKEDYVSTMAAPV
ncbi:MAG: DUF4388 domain-containing protein [Thermodesulfobacteriota bacterium]